MRLTSTTFPTVYNDLSFTPTQEQLLEMGASKGLPEWFMIGVIGTTENEGYFDEEYLLYEWACTFLNYWLENYYPAICASEQAMYNIMAGWGAGYSYERIHDKYNNATEDTLKCVYLAFVDRDRNTRAVSGDYYDDSWYPYFTSSIYLVDGQWISVWYATGQPIIDDSDWDGSISFTERTQSPAGSFNPCYMTNQLGTVDSNNWNTSIVGQFPSGGSPVYGANVLANCVGYAQGRALEIYNEVTGYNPAQTNTHPFTMLNGDAKTWYSVAQSNGFDVSQNPAAGAIICWGTGFDPDSAFGHVGVVEKVVDSNTIITTESGYGGIAGSDWISQTRTFDGVGNWLGNLATMGGYAFQGFILNPANPDNPRPPEPPVPPTTKKKSKWWMYMKKRGVMII